MCLVHRATLLPPTGGRHVKNEEHLAAVDLGMPGLSGVRGAGSGDLEGWADPITLRPSTGTAT